jgi:hypothetical protein
VIVWSGDEPGGEVLAVQTGADGTFRADVLLEGEVIAFQVETSSRRGRSSAERGARTRRDRARRSRGSTWTAVRPSRARRRLAADTGYARRSRMRRCVPVDDVPRTFISTKPRFRLEAASPSGRGAGPRPRGPRRLGEGRSPRRSTWSRRAGGPARAGRGATADARDGCPRPRPARARMAKRRCSSSPGRPAARRGVPARRRRRGVPCCPPDGGVDVDVKAGEPDRLARRAAARSARPTAQVASAKRGAPAARANRQTKRTPCRRRAGWRRRPSRRARSACAPRSAARADDPRARSPC